MKATIWPGEDIATWPDDEGTDCVVEAERTEADEVALHTSVDGQGSKLSIYWSREGAIAFATELLNAASLR